MAFETSIKRYLCAYQNEYRASINNVQHTAELSFRVPLHEMFQHISHDLNPSGNFDIILEPKNQSRMGRPDWRIHDSVSLGVYGYIEAKGISSEPLNISIYQNQIERYLNLGHKLIITDGIDFAFCYNENPVVVSLIDKTQLCSSDWSRLNINPLFKFYMNQFFATPEPQYIDEEKLIELVAIRTRNLADEINLYADLSLDEALNSTEHHFIVLLNDLRELVYNHNDPNLRTGTVFANFIAQMIMFCLLFAHRIICSNEDSPIEKAEKIRNYAFNDNVDNEVLIPFRNLMVFLKDHTHIDTFINQWVNECISFLSFVKMTEQQLSHPDYHRLFELFLTKFDKQTRFDFGAFYTPKILAQFVVRLINKVVAEHFDGATIYDDGNTIIDPCCGTGSFLEQIIANDDSDGTYNLCGFEILPAPYMLANYRMALVKQRYARKNLKSNIILANTLSNCLLDDDANERSVEGRELIRAKELSSRPIKLVIGNPPSSDSKRNNVSEDFTQILSLMNDFRPPAENRHGRQNIQKQITNTFMQFLRWSCKKLLNSDNHSVLAFIVPLSFLEAESYKYARKYLVEHFTNIWAIAIDTDARTGIRGDSLFMTMQGRAVILLTREYGIDNRIMEVNFADLSHGSLKEKEAILLGNIDNVMNCFEHFNISESTYSFMPSHPFNEDLYSEFWPISTESGNPGVFLHQCSGAKMAPTALLTHVKKPILKRRSREIASDGLLKAHEWIDGQDKSVKDEKIIAFQNALLTCSTRQELDGVLNENICTCSFRPFVNSNALLWNTLFDYQAGVGGGGARIRPEIKAVYNLPDTLGFSLAHAPKDLNNSLGQFTSFCWYFPDNDLSRRGNGHIYLNQYICNPQTNEVINNVHQSLITHFTGSTELSAFDFSKKMVFYAYAVFCSQVYLDEFYGALFVVNQSENRARIPIPNDADSFLRVADLGEQLATLEKNNISVKNELRLDYNGILNQLWAGFHLEHSRAVANSPYDEENEQFIIKDEITGNSIKVFCPIALQKFTIAGYNVIKDCWLKFHSYRYTHCDFTHDDFKDLLDLFNKIALQMKIVSKVDDILHCMINGEIQLFGYSNALV